MRKKIYNQPQMAISALAPVSVICVSFGQGANTSTYNPGGSTGGEPTGN